MFFAEVGDVRAGGFEDPQAQQSEHGHEREVAIVRGLAGRSEQGLELAPRRQRVEVMRCAPVR